MAKKFYWLTGPNGQYKIHPDGSIERTDMQFTPSGNWVLLGLAHHIFCASWTWSLSVLMAKADSGETVKGYVFDLDHGTRRKWLMPKGKYTFYKG